MSFGGFSRAQRLWPLNAALAAGLIGSLSLAPSAAHAAVTAHTAVSTPRSGVSANAVTEAQALATARRTGKSVQATAATTSTSTLTANPDGTLTLAQSTAPVRKRVAGGWANLDSTLVRNADGSLSPKVTTSPLVLSGGGRSPLVLSGGGRSPLATMRSGPASLALSLPAAFTLTAPTLSGPTATYHGVLPGVDLAVTAQDTGGFSEVLIVQDATAAANPALATVALNTSATGLTLSTDTAGNITAADKHGNPVFTAAAPSMWDSATPNGPVPAAIDPSTGQAVEAHTGNPLHSSAAAPGTGAHRALLKAASGAGRITLTPSASLLTGKNTRFPLYIDPTFTPSGQTDVQQAWAYVSSEYPNQSYWDLPGPTAQNPIGPLHVGYIDDTQDIPNYISTDRSFIQTSVNSGVWGSSVISSYISFHENWSYSCTPSEVDLWQTGGISKTTNDNPSPPWVQQINPGQSVAYGYSTSCGPHDVTWNIQSLMQSAANGRWTNATFGLKATDADEANHNQNSWKQFSNTAVITTKYDHAPNQPKNLSTNPSSACPSSATNATPLGKGDITLKANVSDPDGTISPLTAQFVLTNMSSGATYPQNIAATSGTPTQATYSHTSTSGPFQALTAKTEFSWNLTTTDQDLPSPPSATCYFYYDPTAPGAPSVAPVTSSTSYCPDLAATSHSLCTIGTSTGFTLTDTNTTTGTPASYLYQLNDAAPISVSAGTGSPYTATIALKPTRQTDTLTVTAVSIGGNIGDTYTYQFLANAPATATYGDMTSDGHADLLAVGGQNSLPAGLWLARGNGDGTVNTAATNIGINGNAVSDTTRTPDTFTGTQAITGHFGTGGGFNDVLDYSYNTTTGAVSGEILYNPGDGSPLNPADSVPVTNSTGVFTIHQNGTPYYATSIANGGDLYNNANGNPDSGFPDLLLLVNGSLYDEPSYATAGSYGNGGLDSNGVQLSAYNPYCMNQNAINGNTACTTDWTGWTITSTLDKATDLPAVFARDTSTSDPSAGQLWYLTTGNLNTLIGNGGPDPSLAMIKVANSGWDSVSKPFIQAADINGDGTPDLWTLDTAGKPTAQLMTVTGNTAALAATSNTALQTSTHDWPLSDYTANSAQDYATSVPLTLSGNSGVTTYSGDQFNPDVKFDGTSGHLAPTGTPANAVDLTGSFTLSVWAKPTALGGVALSQDGSTYSGFLLYPTGNGWEFDLNTGDGTASSWDHAIGGTVHLNAWTHLTATYNKSGTSGVMSLYVDDVFVNYASHTAPTTAATGAFQIGADRNHSVPNAFFAGQIAQVQTWNGTALTPTTQPYTPGAYHQPIVPERILDTRQTTANTYSGAPQTNTPLAANGTLTVPIVGDHVTPTATGGPTAIPPTATAVSVDVTAVTPTAAGNITTYPDGTQRPITSSANFTANTNVTGYQIVPIGLDGKIALYNGSTGTTHLVVDITGFYTTDPTQTGDQTYHPFDPAQRALATANGIANTTGLNNTGPVPANTTFNLQITGNTNLSPTVPANATAVAVNLTTYSQTNSGYLKVYPAGDTVGSLTNLTYGTTDMAQMSADVPIGTNGQISIYNYGGATDIIIDVAGYYTTDTSGDLYHATSPTRLVDTRYGIGGTTGAIPPNGNYTISQAAIGRLTTASTAIPATMLTVTDTTAPGNIVAYGTTKPTTSNVNWTSPGTTVANLALPPLSSAGTVNLAAQGSGSIDLVVDCSGYFADETHLPTHDWPLNDGTGTTAADTAGSTPLTLSTSGTAWTTGTTHGTVLTLDGTTGDAASAPAVISTQQSFSISAWVNLTTLPTRNATVASQDGTTDSGFYLGYDYTNSNAPAWALYFATTDTTNPTFTIAYSTTATTGWNHLTGVYDATTKTAQLYVNGALAATATGVTTWNATGPFALGKDRYNGNPADYFPGQISNAETWNYALTPAQAANL